MTVDTHIQTLPFTILTAFTDRVGGGNPAAFVTLPPSASIPTSTLLTIAKNFNQPMTAFITPRGLHASDPSTAVFDARFFTVDSEHAVCGHATLASAKALFADTALVPKGVQTLRFEASGGVLVARKEQEGRFEIGLKAAELTELQGEEADELRAVLALALGKDVLVTHMAKAAAPYAEYVLIEVDTSDLGALKVNLQALLATKFGVHVLTARSAVPGVAFESRMFWAPDGNIVMEDPVCGSAHCLLTPYWTVKNSLQGQLHAKQVSERGGDLRVQLDGAEGQVKLAGEVTKVFQGEIYL